MKWGKIKYNLPKQKQQQASASEECNSHKVLEGNEIQFEKVSQTSLNVFGSNSRQKDFMQFLKKRIDFEDLDLAA